MNALLRYARLAAAALLASAMLCGVASAQNEWTTPTVGKTVVGVGSLCLNSSGQMVPMFSAAGAYQCAGAGLPVVPAAGAGTRVEGSIVSGGTAQNAFSATPANGWEIININQTETLFVRENGTATATYNAASTPILPGGSYTTPPGYKPTGDVSVIAATTAHTFIARRW